MEKGISFYWFIIVFIVATAISLMVIAFYDHPYDVREAEASILKDRIADCIAPIGKLNINLVNDSKFNSTFADNFIEECNINLKSEESYGWDEIEQYYFEVRFKDINNKEVFSLNEGNAQLKGHCLDNPDGKFDLLPECTWSSFYSIDNEKNRFFIDILTTVRKTEKNAKQ